MAGRDFAHVWDESESVHVSQFSLHILGNMMLHITKMCKRNMDRAMRKRVFGHMRTAKVHWTL